MTNLQFGNYDLYFYGSWVKISPQKVIAQNNNKEILGACRSPKNLGQLQKLGINVTKDQIKMLEETKLLKEENGIFKTTFPILSKDEMSALREEALKIAVKTAENIQPELEEFLKGTKKTEVSPYLLFFSYILDGLVWECFKKENKITDMVINNRVGWIGVLWGSFLPRQFFLGTNEYPLKDGVIKFIWNNEILQKVKEVIFPEEIGKYITSLTVSIINQKSKDSIYKSSLRLSEKIAEEVLGNLNLAQLMERYKFSSEKETLVIVYHELMWSLLEELERQGLLNKPEIISNPSLIKKAGLSLLSFKVVKN